MSEDPYATPSPPPSLLPSLPAKPTMGDDAGMRLLLPVGRSGWAIAAGYLGLFCLVLLPSPLAIIISIIAIRDIWKSKLSVHPKHGMGRAIFGLVMGIISGVVLAILLLKY